MSKLFSNFLIFCNQFKYSIWLYAVWGFLFSQTIIGEAKIITVDSSIGQSVALGGQTVFNSIQKAIDTANNGDTINTSTNHFPVYYSIDISDPSAGKILFSSPLFDEIDIEHSLKYCDGNLIFD